MIYTVNRNTPSELTVWPFTDKDFLPNVILVLFDNTVLSDTSILGIFGNIFELFSNTLLIDETILE